MRVSFFLKVLVGVQLLAGCSTWHALMGGDEEPVKSTDDVVAEAEKKDKDDEKKPKNKSALTLKDEQELKIARLWARVDGLEEEQLRNKERIRVLEKGILLGLVPEELKGGKKNAPIVKEPLYDKEPAKAAQKAVEKKEEKAPPPPDDGGSALNKEQADQYQAALAGAHDLYRAGRYGRAIVEYDKIGKDFKVDGGMYKYWIGKCWSNLKEYNTARQILVDFVTEHASSPWIPRAKLELARVEWKLGLQDTSLQRFKEIIQAYPYEDAAEMAKMELENLGKTL